jgi:hypothetical protein
MKKFLLSTLFMLFFSQAQFAQNYEHCIVVVMNYDNGVYMGRTAEEIAEYEPDWYKDQPCYENRFYKGFEERLHKRKIDKLCRLISAEDIQDIENAAYVIQVNIHSVDTNGNTAAIVDFKFADTNALSVVIRGEGGVFGTWLNLFGDGMQSLGGKIVDYIHKNKLL